MAWPESESEVYELEIAACRLNGQYAAIVAPGCIRVVLKNAVREAAFSRLRCGRMPQAPLSVPIGVLEAANED
jgi:hypothetical protein